MDTPNQAPTTAPSSSPAPSDAPASPAAAPRAPTIEDQLDELRSLLTAEKKAREGLAEQLVASVRSDLAAIRADELDTAKHIRATVPSLLERHLLTEKRLDAIEKRLVAAGFFTREQLQATTPTPPTTG